MHRLAKLALGTVTLAALFTGCQAVPAGSPTTVQSATAGSTGQANTSSGTSAGTAGLGSGVTDFLTDNIASHAEAGDAGYDIASATTIALSGTQDVTICEPGTYVLTGSLTDASVIVDSAAEGKVRLVLTGVQLTSTKNSPIIVKAADEVVLVLADGTASTITDKSPHADSTETDSPNAAIFSMADLTIAGTGSLEVTCANADGIASKDGLVVLSGNLTVTAADDGLRGKDYVILDGGELTIEAGGDGLKSTNEDDDTVGYVAVNAGNTTISAGDDGVHAEGDLVVAGGKLTIAKSVEGMEGANIVVAAGTTSVTSSDDGLNATSGSTTGGGMGGGPGGEVSDGSQLVITGGELIIDSTGDGLDSNGTTTITGGTVLINGPTGNDNGAIDTTSLEISGGVLVAAGSAGMVVTPTAGSAQGWVLISRQLSAGQTLQVSDGNTVLAGLTVTKSAAAIVVSAPGMTTGQTYQVLVDGQSAGSVTAGEGASGGFAPGPGGPGAGQGGGPR